MRRGVIAFIPSSPGLPGRTRHFTSKYSAGEAVLDGRSFFFQGSRAISVQLIRSAATDDINDSPKLMSAQFDFVVDA